ncbi:hypothetical protein J2X63_003171 [Agromyces sp. 3263]|uniref:hypothetical protein n=1 Tax=Agromyces sp. 3263 TaxID=2817750 RepID=UPI0028676BFA|nr:hypothetical protein [Agromyces sp. 3263]MDR6907463.1 hypothetical protein [Agromyces sp. 3263]
MGVDIRVGGEAEWNASGITVSEDATPLDPSDNFGGVGAVAFTIPENAGSKSLLNADVTVTDAARGTTQGVVKALAGENGSVKVDALTRLSALVADRTALPHVGTLESLLLYYFGLCGITDGIVIDETVGAVEVVVPGWYGDVWQQLKKLTAAYQFEIIPVGTDIAARPPRTITADRVKESAFSWALDESQLAQTVEAWYYPAEEITDALVVGNELSPVANLDAGEVFEFDIQLDASLSSVVQPVPATSVGFGESSASVYSVLDQFDNPVPADAWTAGGGSVTVEIGEDTRTLHVTVVGSQNRFLAPYRLAGKAISGAEYSTLRVIGTGVSFERKKYVLPASTDDRATDIVGAEVDNEFLSSWGHAHLVLLHSARRHGGVTRRISGSAWHVLSAADFSGQAYGNVAGARIFEDFNVYRIRSATITPSSVSYEAEVDTTIADTNAVNEGFTIAEWNAFWAGRPISEFNLRPLTPIGVGGGPEPVTGYGSGVYGGPPTYGG